MSDHDPINELTDVVDLFGAAPRRAVSSPVVGDGLPKLPEPFGTMENADEEGHTIGWVEGYTAEQVRQAMREAYEAGRAAGVPDGWKLVPAEPDEDMVYAGSIGRRDQMVDAADVYRAMLAVAPQPPKDAP